MITLTIPTRSRSLRKLFSKSLLSNHIQLSLSFSRLNRKMYKSFPNPKNRRFSSTSSLSNISTSKMRGNIAMGVRPIGPWSFRESPSKLTRPHRRIIRMTKTRLTPGSLTQTTASIRAMTSTSSRLRISK